MDTQTVSIVVGYCKTEEIIFDDEVLLQRL
jgi:hypothetical protein